MPDAHTYSDPRGPRRNNSTARARGPYADQVLRRLRQSGPLTRGELGELCGLSRTTLYEVVSRLVDSGLVIATVPDAGPRGRGRPAERLALNPEAGNALGIEFGRRTVRVATAGVTHDDIGTASEPCPPTAPWPVRIAVARRLADALTGGRLRPDTLDGVGAAVTDPAGTPDQRALAGMLGRAFGTPVRLENAARPAALAETVWGAARGQRDVLYLELSERVGGGLVTAGALHRGAHGRAGEFAHITADPGGAPCDCGGRGCLRTVASATAVLDAWGAAGDLPALAAALCSGDPAARAAVRRAGTLVGRVLACLTHALAPGVVVVGGELVTAAPQIIESVRGELRAAAGPALPVRAAELGDRAAALGALALLRRPAGNTPAPEPSYSAFNPGR